MGETRGRATDDTVLRRLLERFVTSGDEAAFEDLVLRTRPRLAAAARRIGRAQDADDTVQVAYHSLLRRGERLPEGPVFPWLLTAVVRIAYRKIATDRRQEEIARRLSRPAPGEGDAGDAYVREEEATRLREAVAALPDTYRDVVALHHLEGLSTTEVATLLGVPVSTVTTRLQRARGRLRRELEPRGPWALAVVGAWFSERLPSVWAGPQLLGGIMQWKTVGLVTLGGVGLAGWLYVFDGPQEPEEVLEVKTAYVEEEAPPGSPGEPDRVAKELLPRTDPPALQQLTGRAGNPSIVPPPPTVSETAIVKTPPKKATVTLDVQGTAAAELLEIICLQQGLTLEMSTEAHEQLVNVPVTLKLTDVSLPAAFGTISAVTGGLTIEVEEDLVRVDLPKPAPPKPNPPDAVRPDPIPPDPIPPDPIPPDPIPPNPIPPKGAR